MNLKNDNMPTIFLLVVISKVLIMGAMDIKVVSERGGDINHRPRQPIPRGGNVGSKINTLREKKIIYFFSLKVFIYNI
jgi:hypothetical protein